MVSGRQKKRKGGIKVVKIRDFGQGIYTLFKGELSAQMKVYIGGDSLSLHSSER